MKNPKNSTKSILGENVTVKVKLERTSPVTSDGVAQPINGELAIYGVKTIGGEFRKVSSATGLEFDSSGVATVTIPRSELDANFFRPVIESR